MGSWFGDLVKDPVKTVFGTGGSGGFNETVENGVNELEMNRKKQLYNDMIANTHIDDITRNELVDMFQTMDSGTLASKITDATSGKGIYAARLYNQSIKNYALDMPGRAQLTPSLANRVV